MTKFLLIFTLFQQVSPQDTIPLVDGNRILEESLNLMNEEKYAEAITQLIKIHPEDTNFNLAGYRLISSFAKNGQLEKADSMVALLKKKDMAEPSLYLQYGNAYSNAKQYDKAISIYREGLESFPFNHFLTYNIGFAKTQQEKYDEAIQCFQEVLKTRPFYSPAHQMLGNICSNLGFRTKALLSYATYLAINSDKNWALVRMNSLSDDAYRAEGSFKSDRIVNRDFEYYDNLSRSRAAMDDRFKSKVDFEAPVAQQFELMISKLTMNEDSDDFWMNYYVPAYTKLEEAGLTADFIYYLLTSANNEDVNAYLEKNTKSQDAWIEIFNTSFTANRLKHERTLAGETTVYQHWYYNDNSLSAIGNKTGEKTTGPWVYYHENGVKSAEGTYTNNGDKEGSWNYYHDNGELSSEQIHDETGLVQGEIKRYSEDGILTSITSYKNDDLHGDWRSYYRCGTISEKYPYKNGEGTGKGMVFYETGAIKVEYNMVSSMLEGDYISYHLNGEVSNKYSYVEDNKEGKYVGYHYNGQISEQGTYSNDLATGSWEYYFSNGKLSSKGDYREGEKTGDWRYYYSNGTIQTEERYKDGGMLEGASYLYSLDEKKYADRIYADNLLVSYKFFDKNGELIYEDSDPSGNFKDYRFYYPSGLIKSKGKAVGGILEGPYKSYYVNGKIKQEGMMKNGNWDGNFKEYDETGNLILEYHNREGVADGYYRGFYENGQVEEEGWIVDGKAQQRWREYWMDGTIKNESYFVDGDLQGLARQYGPKGKLFEEKLFRKNEQLRIIQYDTTGVAYHVLDVYGSEGERSITKYLDGSKYFSTVYKCGKAAENINFHYPDGKTISEYEIKNTQYSGSYVSYDLLGRLTGKGQYENDSQEGEWLFYHENGQVETRYNYEQDQLQGTAYEYYENGELKIEYTYVDDEQHGQRTQYSPTGEIMLIKYYVKDHGPTGYQYKLKNGSLSDTIQIPTTGRFEVKSRYPNGKVSAVQQYKDYYFDGDLIYYDEDGNILRKTSYKEGERQDDNTHYYSNGKVKTVIPNYYGEEHGEVRKYYENGQLMESTEYLFGVKNGWSRLYDREGKILKEVYYWNDIIYSK